MVGIAQSNANIAGNPQLSELKVEGDGVNPNFEVVLACVMNKRR